MCIRDRGRGSPALPDIRAAHQIVQTDIEEVSDGDQAVEVRKALIQFIALILSLIHIYFRTKSFKRLKLEGLLAAGMELRDRGETALVFLTLDMLSEVGAQERDIEDLSLIHIY